MAIKYTSTLTRSAIVQTMPDFTDIELWNKLIQKATLSQDVALHNNPAYIKRDINISSDQLSRTDIIYLTDAYVTKPYTETLRNAINDWLNESGCTVTGIFENIADSDVPAVINHNEIDQVAIDAANANP